MRPPENLHLMEELYQEFCLSLILGYLSISRGINRMSQLHNFHCTDETAFKDEQSGFYTEDFFLLSFEREIARSTRSNTFFALAMMDITAFPSSSLNDLNRVIREGIRDDDLAGRYSTDTIAILYLRIESESAFLQLPCYFPVVLHPYTVYHKLKARTVHIVQLIQQKPMIHKVQTGHRTVDFVTSSYFLISFYRTADKQSNRYSMSFQIPSMASSRVLSHCDTWDI